MTRMNVYFVNKESTLKGPYDIVDATRTKIIRMGDVCIQESNQGLSVLLVVSSQNDWKYCKLLGHTKLNYNFGNNKLLFSFNGIKQRLGNQEILELLSCAFNNNKINLFFKNALNILTYQCDLWDVTTLNELLQVPISNGEKRFIHKPHQSNTKYVTLFESYLSKESQFIFEKLYNDKQPLKKIYTTIRQQYASDFRKALFKFIKEHPKKTIYDKWDEP